MKKTLLSILALAFAICSAQAADYNITKYGAVSDTTRLSTKAVQRAIDACSAAGGGRVVVPTGGYKIGSIFLKSNVHLYLEQGATLYGSTNINDYQPVGTDYVSLRTQQQTVQLIFADKVSNVSIDGYGTIDGQGYTFKKTKETDEGITRPHLLRFIQSQDITIRNITMRNSGCWMQHFLACDRVKIDGVTIFNRNNYNNDALDLDGCHNVVVTNLISDSDDDGITLKSTSPRLCENITISNCVVSTFCNAIKLGTETNGGFRNINISNIIVKPSSDNSKKFFGRIGGISAISLEMVDGGVLENVNVSNIVVEGTASPIFIRLGNRARGYKEGMTVENVGKISGVSISNVQIHNADSFGCSITGLPGYPVENISLDNITLHHKGGVTAEAMPTIRQRVADEREKSYPEATMWGTFPAKGFFVRHARNVKFSNIEIRTEEPDVRNEFVLLDVE